mmetsp:Transcript_56907/g.184930  ORF Transcript_56907/g.184930 Transcript_56907/m.184930 type:complete len:90 (-) Transcript_56907:8-277(-)
MSFGVLADPNAVGALTMAPCQSAGTVCSQATDPDVRADLDDEEHRFSDIASAIASGRQIPGIASYRASEDVLRDAKLASCESGVCTLWA